MPWRLIKIGMARLRRVLLPDLGRGLVLPAAIHRVESNAEEDELLSRCTNRIIALPLSPLLSCARPGSAEPDPRRPSPHHACTGAYDRSSFWPRRHQSHGGHLGKPARAV